MIKTRYQVILLAAVVLGVFYPTVFAEFCIVDDVEMVNNLERMTSWSLKGVFTPGVAGGLYYRPLIHLSFIADKYVFGLDPVIMHLENIIIHLVNSILVYLMARHILLLREKTDTYVPLVAALLFAIHPVNTEAVNWISARTDLLAGSFVLAGTVLLLQYRASQDKKYLIFASTAILFGMLSKEVALAFLPGLVLILTARNKTDDHCENADTSHGWELFIKRHWITLLLCISTISLFFILRSLAFTSNYSKIGLTLKFIFNDLTHSIFIVLRAFGFYLKKLFIPYPLNFSIMEADPLYELMAIPLVFICIYIASRRTMVSAVFIAGIILITPSFVIAFNQIAWTTYAERYLYVPSAFIITSGILFLKDNFAFPNNAIRNAIVATILLFMTVTTITRNITWQTNRALLKDTAEKSPWAKDAQVLYGILLAQANAYENALQQADKADTISRIEYDDRSDMIRAYVSYRKNDLNLSLQISEKMLERSNGTSVAALKNLISMYEKKIANSSGRHEQKVLARNIEQYLLKLYEQNHDPFLLYKLGKLSRRNGRKKEALYYFRKASRNMSENNEYRQHAKRHLEILERML